MEALDVLLWVMVCVVFASMVVEFVFTLRGNDWRYVAAKTVNIAGFSVFAAHHAAHGRYVLASFMAFVALVDVLVVVRNYRKVNCKLQLLESLVAQTSGTPKEGCGNDIIDLGTQ